MSPEHKQGARFQREIAQFCLLAALIVALTEGDNVPFFRRRRANTKGTLTDDYASQQVLPCMLVGRKIDTWQTSTSDTSHRDGDKCSLPLF